MKTQNIRIYLLGIFAILASWMIATWQTLIEIVKLSVTQLSLIIFIQLFMFTFLINLWINPKQSYKEYLNGISGVSINAILAFILLLIISFLPSNFTTQIISSVVAILFLCLLVIPPFMLQQKKPNKLLQSFLTIIFIALMGLLMIIIILLYVFRGFIY